MTKQPEALRLAEKSENGSWIANTNAWREEAAEELRRLHQEIRDQSALERLVDKQCAKLLSLHEVNQELLEALKTLIDMDVAYQRGDKVAQAVESAQAVIAKAEEQA